VSAGRRPPVFLTRTQHRFAPWAVLVSGAAVTVVIGLLALLTDVVGHPFLMTSFAASCVLEFVLPAASLPLIIMQDAQDWSYLFTPILVGTVIIVVLGLLYRRLTGSRLYR
jgi:CBS-domain-containing membrane protein